MGEKTGIAWARHTWSPWVGCQAVSAACAHCYAEELTNRWGGDFAIRRRTSTAYWKQLATWNRKAAAARVQETVFPSMCDPFDNKAPVGAREDMWQAIRGCPALIFLLLTKRPQNIVGMLPPDWDDGWPNVWLGTTVENQTEANRRIPHLLAVPAKIRFLSIEPLLEPINLRDLRLGIGLRRDALTGYGTAEVCVTGGFANVQEALHLMPSTPPSTGWIDWVIVGGESGSKARPMQREWVEDLMAQCRVLRTPFFFKQVGHACPEGWPRNITGKGDDSAQWPAELRVQEFPRG